MIQSLLSSGQRYNSRHLNLYWDRESSVPEKFQVAYLVPGKSGNAVERNRIKRWLREDFIFLQKQMNISGIFAVKFKGTISEVNHPQLKGELEKLFLEINDA